MVEKGSIKYRKSGPGTYYKNYSQPVKKSASPHQKREYVARKNTA